MQRVRLFSTIFIHAGFSLGMALFCWPGSAQVAEKAGSFPRPVAIWPTGPIDLAVAFDRPVEAAAVAKLVGRTIDFITAKPVQSGTIRIAGADLKDDGRTLVFATDPHPSAGRYRLQMAGNEAWNYDLCGVEASWTAEGGAQDDPPTWTGWLPLLDLLESQKVTRGSASHDRGYSLFRKAGQLLLTAQVLLPQGKIRTEVVSNCTIEELTVGNEVFQAEEGAAAVRRRELTVESTGEAQFLSIRVRTTGVGPAPTISFHVQVDGSPEFKPLARNRLLLPWVPILPTATAMATLPQPSLVGGNVARGEALFHGDQAQCSRCHRVRGKGGEIGPDLTSIGKKGPAEIYQSIATPSASIDAKYVAFSVSAKDGRVASGIVRAEGAEEITVSDTAAKVTRIARREIDQIRPSSASIMPVGLASAIGEERVRDLIAFLLSAEAKP